MLIFKCIQDHVQFCHVMNGSLNLSPKGQVIGRKSWSHHTIDVAQPCEQTELISLTTRHSPLTVTITDLVFYVSVIIFLLNY